MARMCTFLSVVLVVFIAHVAIAEDYPTCDCWTRECGYCSKPDCTVKQDLSSSNAGITVSSRLTGKSFNTIVLYDEAGEEIGKFRLGLKGIHLTGGCIACRTPGKLKRARTRGGGQTEWAFSMKGGQVQIAIGGRVLYSKKLKGECAERYANARRFAFSGMGCENSFVYSGDEMELGDSVTSDCGGACSLQ